jgi:hypothetical protein
LRRGRHLSPAIYQNNDTRLEWQWKKLSVILYPITQQRGSFQVKRICIRPIFF